jgi:excisionase family DNA binding protein
MLSVAELAAALSASRRVVYQMHRMRLSIYKVGTRRKILTADVVEYIRQNFNWELAK